MRNIFIQKNNLLIPIFILFSFLLHSQNEWTWIKGPNVQGAKGTYGTINVPNANNNPGCRFTSLSWTDLNGNLWLYGGGGKDTGYVSNGTLSDLWKFDVVLKQWTWVSGSQLNFQGIPQYGTLGVGSTTNSPGYRSSSATWVDNSGDLWLFGGGGYDSASTTSGFKNDLWKYNISSNTWTWVNGSKGIYPTASYGTQGLISPSNMPGGRQEMAFWKDLNDNFWIFGGYAVTLSTTTNILNDLWKYDKSLNQWVWMKGTIAFSQAGIYGTANVSNSTNCPGSRRGAFYWTDKSGFLWLYGGEGKDGLNISGTLNDLWKYNSANNQWVWMKGTNAKNQIPVYGIQNVFASGTRPGAMSYGACWRDSIGNLWLGNSSSTNGVGSGFSTNIMWRYDINLNQWTWTKGQNILNDQPATYGTIGVSAINNIPGGRDFTHFWNGKNGEFWLFGGWGLATPTCCGGQLSDLWRFIPCYTNTTLVTNTTPVANYTLCDGSTTNLSASSAGTITWYDTNSNATGSGTLFATPTLTTNQTNANLYTPYTFLFGDNISCMLSSITVSVFPNPGISISVTSSVICAGSSTTLNALSGAYSYTWNTGPNTTTISVSPTVTTTYTVSAANWPTECKNTAVTTITVNTCTGLNEHIVSGNKLSIFPNPNNGSFKLQMEVEIENGELILFNMIGQKVFSQKIRSGENEIKTQGLAKGLYHYSIFQNKTTLQTGKIVIE